MSDSKSPQTPPFHRRYGQEIRFLVTFVVVLGLGFTLIAWNPVNDRVIEPFTAGIAEVSGAVLSAIGQGTTMQGTVIRSPRFAVNIQNGCNGIEALIIYCAAVLAFPAPWRSKAFGLVFGFIAIQIVNLIRVVALFLTGVYLPKLFDSSHTVIWQTIVILAGVLLWILWANRFVPAPARAGAPPPSAPAPQS
jgi:exosortase H (IPTLxxWG-CTERM-specific)